MYKVIYRQNGQDKVARIFTNKKDAKMFAGDLESEGFKHVRIKKDSD